LKNKKLKDRRFMGPEQKLRPGEENYIQDPDKARKMAEAESVQQERAAEWQKAADQLRELASKQILPGAGESMIALAEEFEKYEVNPHRVAGSSIGDRVGQEYEQKKQE